MIDSFKTAVSAYQNYNGTGMQMALFFASLIYLLIQKKDKDKRFFFAGYTLLFFIICFFPLTAKLIMEGIGKEVYWRMFWLLPVTVVTAYTAVQILMQAEGTVKRYLLLAAMLLVIVLTGTNVYNSTIFEPKQNNYKLPQDAVDICDMIEQDAKANGIAYKKLITVNELVNSIRQYDADIQMPYANEAIMGRKIERKKAAEIFRLMNSEHKNWEALAWYAAMEKCNYLAYPADGATAEILENCGYEIVGSNASYIVYRLNRTKKSYNGQWLITQYGGADGNQLMFYILQDNKGHMIVVDGGWIDDAEYVKQVIRTVDPHVDAWILTHPHFDHIGAFTALYNDLGKIEIDKVYAVDMASPELCKERSPWDDTSVYEQFLQLDIEQLEYLHQGDAFDLLGLTFEVFNAYDDYVDDYSDDLLNDGSMMFKITAEDESMLFCADVGKRMSDYLLDTWGDKLKSDYIQMGHHGNGGLKSDFYQFIGAKGAFFDAPEWLMHDTSGQYTTAKNSYLMSETGALVYSFATTPNQIILK